MAFSEAMLEESLESLRRIPDLEEGVILSTCNRVEICAHVLNGNLGLPQIQEYLCKVHGIDPADVGRFLYAYQDAQAVAHVFRVAASLDSMVVGEPQITGQVKDAYARARKCGAIGPVLSQLFDRALAAAKRVRTETAVGESAVSVSFAAVELARKIFGSLEDKVVMLVGAGETAELAARHLVSNGVKTVFVANRTYERAVRLAQEFGGSAVHFDRLAQELRRVDIVITSTGAPHYLIDPITVQECIRVRRHRPLFFIDIAVPRDVDPAVHQIGDVYLYDIDDLQSVVEANLKEREKEAEVAEKIISEEVFKFWGWLEARDAVPVIVSLRQWAEEIRSRELEKALQQLGPLSERDRRTVEILTTSIVNKLLHTPIVNLKDSGEKVGERGHYLKVVRHLFGLGRKEESS
ncbi:MAG: glutamyl-tRNA reductase [Candidatus Tectomicrobia bacterium]|uniref:Glutamyl-tRNA reductase n=1 Tax=Tectimicrobiota bacterium TaxID=2528274 RepID=A0A932M0A3_UNCTE|nr:glutamyl-tRNA reductase [Candidatus Tectomicrobia bacterium]